MQRPLSTFSSLPCPALHRASNVYVQAGYPSGHPSGYRIYAGVSPSQLLVGLKKTPHRKGSSGFHHRIAPRHLSSLNTARLMETQISRVMPQRLKMHRRRMHMTGCLAQHSKHNRNMAKRPPLSRVYHYHRRGLYLFGGRGSHSTPMPLSPAWRPQRSRRKYPKH